MVNGSIPQSKRLLWCISEILKMDASEYDEPLQAEPILSKQYAGTIETDSDHYIANQIWSKQMRYEESDRYVSMRGLRYGL